MNPLLPRITRQPVSWRSRSLLTCLLLGLLAACAQTSMLDLRAINSAEITNLNAPQVDKLASGQPTQEQLQILAASGVRHIIDLRVPGERDWDESALVRSLGMEYHSIPVSGATGVTSENAAALNSLLAQIGDEPVLMHCASGNRVGALVAVSERDGGASVDAAIAEGRRWGLNQMEPRVREILSQ